MGSMNKTHIRFLGAVAGLASVLAFAVSPPPLPVPVAQAAYHFADFQATPPIHIYKSAGSAPAGLTPAQVKSVYSLPAKGGQGTIAIIGAYDDATLESDLRSFRCGFRTRAMHHRERLFRKARARQARGGHCRLGARDVARRRVGARHRARREDLARGSRNAERRESSGPQRQRALAFGRSGGVHELGRPGILGRDDFGFSFCKHARHFLRRVR